MTMTQLTDYIRKYAFREQGATMVEYGLMVALIAVVAMAAVTVLGVNVRDIFNEIATKL